MRFLTALIVVIVAGVCVGSLLTWLSVQEVRGFGALRAGEWTAWPDAGSQKADPYTDARIAVEGQVPLGAAEGVLFVARVDSTGEPLRRECDYTISGRFPAARFWTLSAQDGKGRDLPDPTGRRRALLSHHSVWTDGSIVLSVSKTLRGGSGWLPLSGKGPLALSLRLYDSQVAGTVGHGKIDMPVIERLRCSA